MGTSKPCLLALTLAALALAASLQLGSAQPVYGDTPSPPFDPNDPNAAYLFGFPFCRCTDYRCGTTPYKMMRYSEQTLANGNYQVCFDFQDVGCGSGNACCNSIQKLMDKIEIQAGEQLDQAEARRGTSSCGGWGRLSTAGLGRTLHMSTALSDHCLRFICILQIRLARRQSRR